MNKLQHIISTSGVIILVVFAIYLSSIGYGEGHTAIYSEAKSLEKRRERLHQIEKKLEDQMNRYQVQLKMVEGEIQQVQQQLDTSIQRAYS